MAPGSQAPRGKTQNYPRLRRDKPPTSGRQSTGFNAILKFLLIGIGGLVLLVAGFAALLVILQATAPPPAPPPPRPPVVHPPTPTLAGQVIAGVWIEDRDDPITPPPFDPGNPLASRKIEPIEMVIGPSHRLSLSGNSLNQAGGQFTVVGNQIEIKSDSEKDAPYHITGHLEGNTFVLDISGRQIRFHRK